MEVFLHSFQKLILDSSDPALEVFEVTLPTGAVFKSKPDDVVVETPFLRASRKAVLDGGKLTVSETSCLLDCRLPASDGARVGAEMRKLRDHQAYVYIASMPAGPLPAAAQAAPPSSPVP